MSECFYTFPLYFSIEIFTSYLKTTYFSPFSKKLAVTHSKKVWIDLFPEPTSLQIVAQLSWELYSKSVFVDCWNWVYIESHPHFKTEWVSSVKKAGEWTPCLRESPHYRQPLSLGPTASKNRGRIKSRLKLAVWGRTSLAWGCTEKPNSNTTA